MDANATSSDLPEGVGAVNVTNEAAGARQEVANFARNVLKEIKNISDPALKKEATGALKNFVSEVRGVNIGAFSTQANGAAKDHTDHAVQNKTSFGKMVGTLSGAAAFVTGNPVAKALSAVLTDSSQPSSLSKLQGILVKAGIKSVGGKPLDEAVAKTDQNVKTIRAVETMRKSGFNGDTIYGPKAELTAGKGKEGIQNFIQNCAERLKSRDKTGDACEFLERPVAASQAMKQEANSTGQKIKAGVRPQDAKTFTAQVKDDERKGAEQISQAVRDQGLIPRVAANAMRFNKLSQLVQAVPSTAANNTLKNMNSIAGDINNIGKRHEEAMKVQDEAAKRAAEAKKKEEELLLAQKAAAAVPRTSARSAPGSAIMMPGMHLMPPSMGAAQREAAQNIPT